MFEFCSFGRLTTSFLLLIEAKGVRMEPEIDPALVTAWIALANADHGTPEHGKHFWAFHKVEDMRDDAEWMWSFILTVLAADQSKHVLAMLAAGPLENLLGDHGPAIIERVEGEVKSNRQFAYLLGGVWMGGMSGEIWQRVQEARNRHGWEGVPSVW